MSAQGAVVGGCDVSDIYMIHGLLAKLLGAAPGLVGSVSAADLDRAALVADHLDDTIDTLHAHHEGEDLVLWDRLEQRAPACVIHVELMKKHHAEIAARADAVRASVALWRATADAAAGETLAGELEILRSTLLSHLGEEEKEILPVAEVALSQAEWDLLAEHGRNAVPKDKQLVQLGYFLDAVPDAQRPAFLRTIPWFVRALYRLVGKRQYDAEQRRLFPEG